MHLQVIASVLENMLHKAYFIVHSVTYLFSRPETVSQWLSAVSHVVDHVVVDQVAVLICGYCVVLWCKV